MKNILHFRDNAVPPPESILLKFVRKAPLAYSAGFNLIFYCNQYLIFGGGVLVTYSKEIKTFSHLLKFSKHFRKVKNCLPIFAFQNFL